MEDETDINEEQAEVGDVPDLDPVEELEQSLEQLEEQGELDSEQITFRPMSLGGGHLDSLDDVLEDVGYDKDPVRITIKPENDHPDDHHYKIDFDYLEHDGRGRLVSSDLTARMDGLEEHLRAHDALVPTEIHDAPNIGRNQNGYMTFEVEAEVVEVNGSGRDHTEYQIPDDVLNLVDDFGGEVRDVALYPDGRGWGQPTYAIEIRVE
jgi:hypothetical protein